MHIPFQCVHAQLYIHVHSYFNLVFMMGGRGDLAGQKSQPPTRGTYTCSFFLQHHTQLINHTLYYEPNPHTIIPKILYLIIHAHMQKL